MTLHGCVRVSGAKVKAPRTIAVYRRGTMRSAWIYLLTILWFLGAASHGSTETTRWFASQFKDISAGSTETVLLGPEARKFKLANGWECEVGATGLANSKQINCIKNREQVSFSVQCDSNRPKDGTQVRFRSANSQDFIDVACEFSK